MRKAPVFYSIREDVLKKYPDKRYYHSVGHIEQITELFDFRYDDFLRLPNYRSGFEKTDDIYDIAMVSLLFHDIVYKTGADDNEDKSAEYAMEYLSVRNLFDDRTRYLISDTILYTKMEHGVGTPLKQLVHDLDWVGFSVYTMLCDNELLLYKEAIRDGFTKEQFRQGRIKFLTHYSKGDIYESPIYRRFNDSTKMNIKRFLREFYHV